MPPRLTPDAAQTIALKALGFLAGSEGALDRLMTLSGLDRDTLRERASEPEFLVSLLDFLLSDEELLLNFCGDASIDPKTVHMARYVLGGP